MNLPGVISLRKLTRLWAKRARVANGADLGLEHHVELARLSEFSAVVRAGDIAGSVALHLAVLALFDVVQAPAHLALLAVDERVVEV